jgi:hypothetical protein
MPGLDPAHARSYRPISNLSVVSKLLERFVARQLHCYLQSSNLLLSSQSAYRPFHSTETAVLRVLSDLLLAVDQGEVAALVLLDLSAAFDTVDHNILLRRLRSTYGFNGAVLKWFQSYLHGRSQCVRRGSSRSASTLLFCGVPQGSVLGPILFILYTADLVPLIDQHSLHGHLYADDTQTYGSCRPDDVQDFEQRISACVDDVALWMKSNRLQLNTDKTEILWCATSRRQSQLPKSSLRICSDFVAPSSTVRDLGIYLDADLSMKSHVRRVTSSCFAILRQLRSLRRSISSSVYRTLIVSLILTKLDYGNATLAGLPAYLVSRLQSVMNAAARSIIGIRRSEHITSTLANLHWLKVSERIKFKLAVLTYRCLHGAAPQYLTDDIRLLSDIPSRRVLRSSTRSELVIKPTRLSTVGDRAFSYAAPRVWNSLPTDVTSAPSLPSFRRRLKTHLFQFSFPVKN